MLPGDAKYLLMVEAILVDGEGFLLEIEYLCPPKFHVLKS